jgi:hypothetical protein
MSSPSPPPATFLVGAARSGTKILRDTLGLLPGVAVVPYDMNFVWRIGNDALEHDELVPGSVSERDRRRIRRLIGGSAVGHGLVLEKTVSNALRVDFVRWIHPEARFIHLVRDGVDVVESVMRQWDAPADWRYLARKVRAVPVSASPRYALHYARSLVDRRRGGGTGVTWGPRYPGIDDDMMHAPLSVVCARQWAACVERALDAFERMPSPDVVTVRYEDLVVDPQGVLGGLTDFLDLDVDPELVRSAGVGLRPTTVGRGRAGLDPSDVEVIEEETRSARKRVEG